MKPALWIWTALCVAGLGVALVALLVDDPEPGELVLFTGAEVFTIIALLVFVTWLVGVGIIASVVALVRIVRRRGGRTPAIVGVAALALAALAIGALWRDDGEETSGSASSSFVSFDTVDADPDWSPDGAWVAFVSSRGGGGVYVVRSDGTAMRRLFRGEASDVDWSPDGAAVAFTGRRGIYVASVPDGTARLALRGSALSLPAWAPNGRELALVKEEEGGHRNYIGRFEDTASAIYAVRLDGTGLRRLLPRHRGAVGDARPGSIAAALETEPAWSPDGRRIAFQAGDGEIVVADVRSGRRVTINQERAGYEPSWSPDGRSIAYQCEGDVCVAAADGSGNERQVASDGGDPSWSPDSRLVVFEHYLYGGTVYGSSPQSLSIVRADGSGLRDLTFGPTS